jgi:hypothetical protein
MMKRLLVLVSLALVVLGCQPAASPTPLLHTITGSFTLTDTSSSPGIVQGILEGSRVDCWGTGGYSDLTSGVSVTLKNQSGTILANTTLGTGQGSAHTCTFHFTLTQVPDDATFYVVTVSHRGDVSHSHAEMVSAGWKVDLTIGS